jgi:hypothetical protein
MTTGATWTNKLQAALEGTRGTGLAATRLLTDVIDPVMVIPKYNRRQRESKRGSLTKLFDAPVLINYSTEISGLNIRPTYESLPWWLQSWVKGSVTGALSNTTVYTYTFAPTGTADDVKSVCFEVGVDTAAYQYCYGLAQKWSIALDRQNGMVLNADYIAGKETAQAFTGALSAVAWEEINGGLFSAWVDTSTIGTTVVAPLDFMIEGTNNWEWVWVGDGNLYPSKVSRQQYDAKVTLTTLFETATERDAYTNNTYRKIRVKCTGTNIASSSPTTAKSVTIDAYGYWNDASFQTASGLYAVKSTANLVYDTTATAPFSIVVVNGLVTLP